MKLTIWVMLIVGIIELTANTFFLINLGRGKGLKIAKKFHGDFPVYATDKAWLVKIVSSVILGIIALLASYTISKDFSIKIILSNLFSFGMLIMCIVQALLYGKKHIPARISVVLGIIFVMFTILKL
ncbi:hypothetical protein ACVRW7_03745 [Streptococcus ratti]|uniref:Integral membrane protein n=1 Tax=Streptococcus ratti FA-1 = DSM 20564 TaxID=699248 RepID=A0ABP2QWZ8_STRRT|nr:hypothetical protein [Streptococcus ratti]EJN93559.1 hypothetical protein SRA_03456 [Streptococcus ratti FA-1 = DSM 20564]EMP71822.1 hypothetical protein D822_00005 [Streptococcus ratti FA-1 = DSM 20564]QEY07429.1 hypothetical protein FY406_07175 [Streptococcus ratti]VEI59879.1 Uncharacterised protein [Streptococcus mutans]